MKSDFFYRPVWQQHSIVFAFILVVFLIGYFYFIVDLQDQAKFQKQLYLQKTVEVQLLQDKFDDNITNNITNSVLSLHPMSEIDFAILLVRHQLNLYYFKSYETEDKNYWDIKLSGNYGDFIALINSFIEDHYYLGIDKLSITKKDNTQLLFVASILVGENK